jgi:hypothetical protein
MWFGNPGDISFDPIPCTEVVEGQATGTLTVDVWTDVGTITWSHSFEADRLYQIVGMSIWSATAHLGRLNLVQNNILAKPGCIGGTTRLAGNHVIYVKLGSFKGSNPPYIGEVIRRSTTQLVATGTSQTIDIPVYDGEVLAHVHCIADESCLVNCSFHQGRADDNAVQLFGGHVLQPNLAINVHFPLGDYKIRDGVVRFIFWRTNTAVTVTARIGVIAREK